MVKPLVMYGATFNMIEDQLLETARHFSIKVTVVRKPGLFVCILGDYGTQRRKIKIADTARAGRRPNVLGLLGVSDTFNAVTKDEMQIKEGVDTLNAMPGERFALSRPVWHMCCAIMIAAGMCAAAHGSVNETVYASQATLILCLLQMLAKRVGDLVSEFLE